MNVLTITCVILVCACTVFSTGPCDERHQNWQENESHRLGSFEPRCDPDGTYQPAQCRDSVCFCVDTEGNELGYNNGQGEGASTMDCNCGRDMDAYTKTGMIGRMFDCDSKGSYSDIQCTGSVCYCSDVHGNQRADTQSVGIWETENLSC